MSPEPAWCPRNLRESSNTELLRRYVYGPGSDEPILWYEGAGTSDKSYLHADERGSIIALSNASGTVTQVNAYDEFGIPQAKLPSGAPGSTATTSFGRFGYTGQAWFPEIGLYHYKARTYSPTLGRFLQSDPIGYGDGMNIYDYVGGDPVNNTDPSGLDACPNGGGGICVTARRTCGVLCFLGRIFSGSGGSLRGNTTTSTFGLSSFGGSAPPPLTIPPAPVARPAAAVAATVAPSAPQGEKSKSKFDIVDCIGTVALGGLGGALNPVGLILDVGGAISGAANQTAREDASFSSKKGPRLKRDARSAVRIGLRRAVSAAVSSPQVRAISAGVGASLALLSSESCGINAIPSPAGILPFGF